MKQLPSTIALLLVWSASAPGIVSPALFEAGPAGILQGPPQNKFAGQKSVTVKGEVVKKGLVALPKNAKLSLQTAIQMAGGLTKKANGKITLKRDGLKPKTYDLKELNQKDQKVWLQPGDLLTARLRFF